MKILGVMTIAALIAAHADAWEKVASRKVAVCIETRNAFVIERAKSQAAGMFAEVGVKIEWHRDRACPTGAIRISFSDPTDVNLLPGAFAYALPYDGTHIQVFYDRVQAMERRRVPRALAHVLVHEITDILQGVSRHSESGVMKADWKKADINEMAFKALPFTEEDVKLIHKGLDARDPHGRREMNTGCRAVTEY